MKERPILFKDEMIRAILEGRKTQTRRVCKQQPYGNGFAFEGNEFLCHNDYLPPSAMLMDVYRGGKYLYATSNMEGWESECPYGLPGDQLWVREAFRLCAEADDTKPRDTDAAYRVWYEADAPHQPGFGKLRPSMFMPRWASRITLEITGVRVERLQDISGSDVLAEGVGRPVGTPLAYGSVTSKWSREREFAPLWEKINGPGSWDANPWVWVVEFKRVKS